MKFGYFRRNFGQALRLGEVFQLFDSDSSGKIDSRELHAALRQSGLGVTQADVDDLVARLDTVEQDGELDFNESLVERVKCLAGAPESVFDDVYEVISLTPGAPEFIWALKTMGYKVAVVSGGFNQVTNRVAADMGIDFAFANTLEVVGGKLTGRTIGPIVNRERKRDLLESLAQTMSIELEQVIAIGDGQPQRLAAIL